ncbi:MAG: hypothetical protein ACOYM7_00415 [Paludibacter sp.]
MKLKIVILIAFVSLCHVSWAEDDEKDDKKVWFGPKYGLDVVSSTADLASLTEQLKTNYQVGFFMQLGKKIYFQPEIYYSSYTTNPTTNAKINYVKAPMMLGLQVLDLSLISLHLNGGPSYLKQLDSLNKGVINWEVGAGINLLGFITTDLRYTIQKKTTAGLQIEQLISNGGMLNLTVGLRL